MSMKTEPVITIAAITSLVTAVFTLLGSFGVALTSAQQAAILGVIAPAAPLTAAVLTRRRVSPSPTGGSPAADEDQAPTALVS